MFVIIFDRIELNVVCWCCDCDWILHCNWISHDVIKQTTTFCDVVINYYNNNVINYV